MPCTNIQLLRMFDLAFWKTSKQIHRKLQYKEKLFKDFPRLPCFPKILFCILRPNSAFFKPCSNIQWLRRFDLSFWQISEQIYRKLRYEEKFFRTFHSLPHFPRKMVLYLLTKCSIFQPCTSEDSFIQKTLFRPFRDFKTYLWVIFIKD